jgi:hypothetical protein
MCNQNSRTRRKRKPSRRNFKVLTVQNYPKLMTNPCYTPRKLREDQARLMSHTHRRVTFKLQRIKDKRKSLKSVGKLIYRKTRVSTILVFQMGMVAHVCNTSYSGGRVWDGQGSRPAQAKIDETQCQQARLGGTCL